MSRTLAIVNPVAGRHAAPRIWSRIHAEVPAARDWDCVTTERPGHARQLAAAAADKAYARVVAVGGDGTISEVANGLARSETALGIIPAGTGNDLAHSLGIPGDPLAAAHLAAHGASSPLDVGELRTDATHTYFLNVAGFGFDAEVAWRANRLPKRGGGTLPYVLGVVHTLWRYAASGMRISIDGQTVDRRVFLVAVGNCPTYAGGMRIVPSARPDDGLLDVCLVSHLSRVEVLRLLPRMYSGGHVRHPAVELFRCRELSADANGRVLCQADGELVGGLPARFGLLAGALRCVTGPARRSTP
jgi:YegS/Rv2252/BmrU family lipid kinase